MERTTRPIRMNAEEWEAFKRLLGTEWLRKQIAKAVRADLRNKPVPFNPE